MKAPSKKAGLLWIVVVGLALWWIFRSSPAAAAETVDERPLYGPPSPSPIVHGDVDFEDPTVITSDPEIQAGPTGYYTYREDSDG